MSIRFNHTIVWCRDQQRSATFLADILGLAAPIRFGPFMVVTLDDGASLDFDQVEGDVAFQHYAFLIDEDDFDAIFARVRERGLAILGRSRKETLSGNQSPQWRARLLLRQPRRPFAGSAYKTVRDRRVDRTTSSAAPGTGGSTHWSSCRVQAAAPGCYGARRLYASQALCRALRPIGRTSRCSR